MWLNDTYNHAWVETGYITYPTVFGAAEDYFWADWRPQDTQINQHDLGGVPSRDYGQNPTFTIHQSSSSSYHVTIASPNFSYSGYSTNNYMAPSQLQMGQELAGTSGASAGNARFSYRYYWNYANTYTGIYGNYVIPPNTPSNPPYLGYISGNTDFYTHCC